MKIFVNGCSHTSGTREALDGDFSKTWPNVLKTFGYDVTDKSLKGCSNDRILRSTTDDILKEHYDRVIIQWTFSERFETPLHNANTFKQHLPWAISSNPENPHNSFYDVFYKRDSSSVRELCDTKIIHQMYLMQTMLQSRNIDYGFMVWMPISRVCLRQDIWKHINTNKILNYNNGQIIGMDTILHNAGHKLSKRPIIGHEHVLDHHYMEDGHRHIAKMVIGYIDSVSE